MENFSYESVPVVLLAGGRATRLQPLSDRYPKAVMPIAGKPLIGRVLDSFRNEGFVYFIVVVPVESVEIKNYISEYTHKNNSVKITMIEQTEPKGMVHAIQCVRNTTESILKKNSKVYANSKLDPFFILSAVDVVLDQPDLKKLVQVHEQTNPAATLAVYKSEDASMAESHGNIKLEGANVADIVEKPGPENRIDDYYSIPVYIFSEKLHHYLDKVEESSRMELELPSAIKYMLSDNLTVLGVELCRKHKITKKLAGKFHLTYVKDLLPFTFRFLREEFFEYTGEYPTLIEPVAAKSCQIGESVLVGPNVFIEKECKIGDYTEISQTILLGNNNIGNNVQIENSIIGENVEIPDGSIIKDSLLIENTEPQDI